MKRLSLETARPGLTDVLLALALLTLLLLLADTSRAQTGSPYGYVRTLEGTATLAPADGEEEPFATSINQPVLPGDRLYVDPGTRLEVVLPEGTRVRAGGDTELGFAVLGAEEDGEGPRLQLLDGELQLTVPDVTASSATPRVDAGNATVYAVDPGQFSVVSRGAQHTLVTVRSGTVEVRTPRGSSVLRAEEALSVDGQEWPEVAHVRPGAWSSLEAWGNDLDERIADARVPEELADDLAYDTAPLERHGDWVDVEGSYAWRPTVSYDWRPYTSGHWYYTPAGLSWVSVEPWGWVTYHYGSWDWVPHYGWVWFPARRWAPAWVYWYWGPDYVGWCPVGIYARHYGPRYSHFGHGFHWGSYGWAGGSWNHFKHWTFVSHGRLHERDLRRHVHLRAADTRPPGGRTALPRGLITTDTSGLSRAAWQRPHEAVDVLARGAAATRPGRGAELPDVTPFIARSADLPADVERRIVAREAGGRSIASPTVGRQALRRVGSGAPPDTAEGGRTVVRVPRGEGYPAVEVTDGIRRPVGRDGETTPGTDAWRRSPDAPGTTVRIPDARSVRVPSRTAPSPPSDDSRREVGATLPDRPVQVRPPATPDRSRPDTGVRTIPDQRSDWRRSPATRPVAPRPEAGWAPDSAPPVRRVIDAVRGAPATPPVPRYSPPTRSTPPTERTAPPSVTRPSARPTVPDRPSSGVSSRSRPPSSLSPSPPSSHGSSSRGVSSRPSGSSRSYSSPPPRRESPSRGSESRGRAASSRSPD
ncbi:MAG: DUF6600 domain-containing protein [Thermoanaerobaculia bacterium]